MSRVVLQCGVSQSAHVQCLATDITVVLVYRVQEPEQYASRQDNARLVRVEPARGVLLPRSSCGVHVHVPDVGAHLGVQRAVLMYALLHLSFVAPVTAQQRLLCILTELGLYLS